MLWCGLAQGPGQVQRDSGKGSEGPGEGLGGFGAEPSQIQSGIESDQVQQGSGKGSGEGLGSFGTEAAQVQQGSGEVAGKGSGRFWYKSKSGSIGFR